MGGPPSQPALLSQVVRCERLRRARQALSGSPSQASSSEDLLLIGSADRSAGVLNLETLSARACGGQTSSIPNWAASAPARSRRVASSASDSVGGGEVRLATGSPNVAKWPGGRDQAQYPRGGVCRIPEGVWRKRGDVHRLARARDDGLAADGHLQLALEYVKHLLECVTVRRWPAGGGTLMSISE